MDGKVSQDIENDLEEILKELQYWEDLFYFKIDFYFDGWAVFLREKSLYPRCIVIFKSNENHLYSVKSFEVHFQDLKTESFKELYSIEKIKDTASLLIELKDIIYGKDLGKQVLRMYNDKFS
ncbi:MAG: hypothetical protein ACW96X_09335 [Promethearchaeota archaeon]|jgi:hypothetical protein